MPAKMAGSDPRPSVRITRGAGSGQHLASVLQEGRENANIDAGLGFIWRISVDMSRRRIAFVYAPAPPPDTARLETMPFAINVITRLAAAGWEVDVFLWEQPVVDYHEIFPTTVRFRYEVMPKRMFYGMRPIRLTARFMSCAN